MTPRESGSSSGMVFLARPFEGDFQNAAAGDAATITALAYRGGWPEVLGLAPAQAQITAREHLGLLSNESVPRHGKDGAHIRLPGRRGDYVIPLRTLEA